MGKSGSGSFADLVTAHAPALLRLAVMLTGDRSDAEDLLQSTLLLTVRPWAFDVRRQLRCRSRGVDPRRRADSAPAGRDDYRGSPPPGRETWA